MKKKQNRLYLYKRKSLRAAEEHKGQWKGVRKARDIEKRTELR